MVRQGLPDLGDCCDLGSEDNFRFSRTDTNPRLRKKDLSYKPRSTIKIPPFLQLFFLLFMFFLNAGQLSIDVMPTVVAALMNSTAQQTVFVVVPPRS